MEPEIDVLAVNREEELVLLSTGHVIPVVSWLDVDGNELDEDEDRQCAVMAIACDGSLFFTVWLHFFEASQSIH